MALKEAGHPQYFGAAVAGVLLLLLGASIRVCMANAFPDWYPCLEKTLLSILPESDDKSGGMDKATLLSFASAATWALLLGSLLPWLLNLPLQANKLLKRAIMKRAGAFDGLEAISSHALDCAICLLITLKNGKAYVGTPLSLSTLDIERKWFAIFPLLSGYRGESHKLELPVNYGNVYQELASGQIAGERIAEFRVLLAVSEIVSLQTFNIATYYESFRKKIDAPTSGAEPENVEGGELEKPEEGAAIEARASVPSLPQADSDLIETGDYEATEWDGGVDFGDVGAISDLSEEEQCRLRAYYGFLLLVMLAVLSSPYSVLVAALLMFIGGLFAVASVSERAFPDS
jgi:hypothetical protein